MAETKHPTGKRVGAFFARYAREEFDLPFPQKKFYLDYFWQNLLPNRTYTRWFTDDGFSFHNPRTFTVESSGGTHSERVEIGTLVVPQPPHFPELYLEDEK